MNFIIFCFVLLLSGFLTGKRLETNSQQSKKIEIRGIYGSPNPFWEKNLRLDQLGVNSVFIHHQSITEAMMQRSKREGLKVFAEFATLNGKNYVEQHPEAWAIDENGQKVKPATWFMGVCPTEPGFKEYRINELKRLLRQFDVDGVWMDYLHWHAQFEDPEPILPETCFCENCITRFQSAKNIQIPAGTTPEKSGRILKNHNKAWRDWRCSVITDWVKDFRTTLKQKSPVPF